MTTSLRDQLIEAFRQTLSERVKPRSEVPLALPLGELADAAIAVLSQGRGVPKVPTYDDELFRARRWTERLTAEMMMSGKGTSLRTFAEDGGVVVQVLADGDVVLGATTLPSSNAQEFALSVLAAVDSPDSGSLTTL
jgi:hypothetical protein